MASDMKAKVGVLDDGFSVDGFEELKYGESDALFHCYIRHSHELTDSHSLSFHSLPTVSTVPCSSFPPSHRLLRPTGFKFVDSIFDVKHTHLADIYKKWKRCLLVTDQIVYDHYGTEMKNYFKHHDIPLTVHIMPGGEIHKVG